MIRRPSQSEWDTSLLPPERRHYLDIDIGFEDIVIRAVNELEVVGCRIKPFTSPAKGEPKDARQVIFRTQVTKETNDLLWNARDGLRARYWQSPGHGDDATRRLVLALSPKLLASVEQNLPPPSGKAAPMTLEDIEASLELVSAKSWPLER